MKFRAFDTHCHLAGGELMPVAEALLERALQNGVGGVAIIAADPESLREAPVVQQSLQKKYPSAKVLYTAGIHPHEAKIIEDDAALWQEVVDLSKNAVAIGETGLDFFYNHSDADVQKKWFKQHIELAASTQKPLVIHCRNSAKEILESLDCPEVHNHSNPGILHCFAEDWPTAKKLLDWNFYISFSGIITFKNAEPLREVVKKVPLEKMLIETDSPWLAPIPHRGKKNEPAFVVEVLKQVQALRSEDPQEVETRLWENSLKVFGVK